MRVLRLMLICLLAVALPVQGWAAATMLSCGPGHHRMAEAHAHEGHAMADEHGGHHDAASTSDLHDLAQFKCSACAACGVVHVLPPAVVDFDLPREPAHYDALLRPAGVSFHTSGQERPPRRPLA
jgi:hypothetical protein